MPHPFLRRLVAPAACAVAVAFACEARADGGGPIVVWPTLTPAGDDASPVPLHKPSPNDQPLAARAQELDATMRDGAQDLGFTLDLADPGPNYGHARDSDLIERAARGRPGTPETGTWVASARLERESGDSFLVRIVAVPPNGRELHVRVESVKGADVSVRGLVMLRDLLSPSAAAQAEASEKERERVDTTSQLGIMSPLRSPGRVVLAVNSAAFGAYVAYSIQRASGSDDPRVLYPLLALGTGIGIGSALLVSDEWDVSTGDAWFLAAGAWWGAGAGVLIANGQHVQPFEDRYAYGIGGGLGGLALATLALTRNRMDEGDAVLTHSGAALGFFVGGIADFMYRGSTDTTPYTGAGLGSAIGLLAAGTSAMFVQVSPSRVMLIDLGAGLGALAGAAAGSPLVFNDITEDRTRGFLAATLGGTVVGGAVAWFLTRDSAAPKRAAWLVGEPTAGVIGQTVTSTGTVPAYGLGWHGQF
jgi:hypothetical protein